MRRYRKKQSRSLKRMMFFLLALLLVVAGALYLRSKMDQGADRKPTDQAVTSQINYDPPTEEEKNPAMDSPVIPNDQAPDSANKKSVTPTVTSADSQGARAFVAGINEEGGTCTAIFTKGQITVTATSAGFSNVSYTSCRALTPSSPLESGQWVVVVSYESATASGKSEPFAFGVE